MNNSRNNEPAIGIQVADIYFVVFRHKWKILLLTLAGIIAAGGYYFTRQTLYQSEAKLFIRYISDSRTVNPSDNSSRVTSLMDLGQSMLNSEMEILTSYDLASQVATNIGPDKILAKYGGPVDVTRAALIVRSNLKVEGSRESSVIHISYEHPDASLVRVMLSEIIREYLDRHAQVHQAIGISDDLLTEQITQLRLQIAQTDEELRMAKTNAGIIDVVDSRKSYAEEVARIRHELLLAEEELAGREGLLQLQEAALTNALTTNAPTPVPAVAATTPTNTVPAADLAEYKKVRDRVDFLQKKENDYLLQQGYTPENNLVKEVHERLETATKAKQDFEAKYPSLLDLPKEKESVAVVSNRPPDLTMLAILPMRIKTLQQQLARLQQDAAHLDEAGAKIADLERKKQVQESSYKYFANSLEEARINEALGPGRVSNISNIQQPSPPFKDVGSVRKKVLMMLFGGLLAGLAWAFAIEFYFDRSVKRAVDVEGKLRLPCFISIPDLKQNEYASKAAASARRQLGAGKSEDGERSLVPVPTQLDPGTWQVNHALDKHYDALRDRLVLYFESINLTRKPKLVAITSTNQGAGVSTIAAGLAASLSETGDGRVLLVDMNQENGAAQQFFDGQPHCKLDDALLSDKRDSAMVQENLYVVSEGSSSDKLTRVLPKRFAALVPQLKASDYDYIIFDMPPVTQTSVTTRLAGFMDTVMLVIESEKTDRETVQQASALLARSKANVSAILNKTRKYVPERLVHDINSKL